jgi:hypothetical protein
MLVRKYCRIDDLGVSGGILPFVVGVAQILAKKYGGADGFSGDQEENPKSSGENTRSLSFQELIFPPNAFRWRVLGQGRFGSARL